jgi:hypothetical protein
LTASMSSKISDITGGFNKWAEHPMPDKWPEPCEVVSGLATCQQVIWKLGLRVQQGESEGWAISLVQHINIY